jgi:catechol 2,3-dioxygenase-like lactoylglutathione lyase family enzyme
MLVWFASEPESVPTLSAAAAACQSRPGAHLVDNALVPSLHHTGLTVRDLDRSIAFYRDVLGMELMFTGERQGGYFGEIVGYPDVRVRMAYLEYRGTEHKLELFQYLRPEPRGEPGEPRDVGITHVCVAVSEIGPIHDRVIAAGLECFTPPVLVTEGVNAGGYGLYLRDPDGAIVELFQPAAVSG